MSAWLLRRAPDRTVLAAGLFAALVGYAVVLHPRYALPLAVAPILVFLITRPQWAATATIISIPVLHDLYGNGYTTLNVGVADVIAIITFLGLVPLVCLSRSWQERLTAVRPMLRWCLPFLLWLVVIFAAHPSAHSLLNTVQDFELVGFGLLLGAGVLERRTAKVAVFGFLAVLAADAVVWLATQGHSSFAGNKNAAGQYFAYGLVLTIALRTSWRWKAPLIGLVIGGLLFSASRGAMVGLVAGGIALLAFRGLGSWRRTTGAVVFLSLALIVGYNAIPYSLQLHVQSILHNSDAQPRQSAAGQTFASLDYNLKIRAAYRRDGLALARAHPFTGVGVGNYLTGTGPTQAIDPHNVWIRNAAEGGYLDDVLFALMVLGTGAVALRRRRRNPWAGTAIALQACMLVHSTVDVYWVRGMPMVAWLFLGMAVNPSLDVPDADMAQSPMASRRMTSTEAREQVALP